MNLRKLLEFAAMLAEGGYAADTIEARCVWRDEGNCIVEEKMASIGYCSGLKPVITIEMGKVNTFERKSTGKQ